MVGLQHLAALQLCHGLALGHVDRVGDGDLLQTLEALQEHGLELVQRNLAVVVGIKLPRHGLPASVAEGDILSADGLRLLREPSGEALRGQRRRSPGGLSKEVLMCEALFPHALPQSCRQGAQRLPHEEALARFVADQRRGGFCRLLHLLVNRGKLGLGLGDRRFRCVLRLVRPGDLPVLGHGRLGLLHTRVQLGKGLGVGLVPLRIPLPPGEETLRRLHGGLRGLQLHHQPVRGLLGLILVSILLGEGLRRLPELLNLRLQGGYLLGGLLHHRNLLPRLRVLLELRQPRGAGVDPLGELCELRGRGLRCRLGELLDLEVLRSDEVPRRGDRGLHRGDSLLGGLHGGRRLSSWEHLEPLEKGHLRLGDPLQGGLCGHCELPALPHEGLAHDALPLLLRERHELADGLQPGLASLQQLLQGGLHRPRHARDRSLEHPRGGLEHLLARREGGAHLLDLRVRGVGGLDAQGRLLGARLHPLLRGPHRHLGLRDPRLLLREHRLALDEPLPRASGLPRLRQLRLRGGEAPRELGQRRRGLLALGLPLLLREDLPRLRHRRARLLLSGPGLLNGLLQGVYGD
mmetsp:Transcript_91578/g.255865  ORF Transcript_91578/g.255865 Transcript_91578/m.255865 type:complete len:577 (+) Transcript_91578:2367-4097(+)